jgi:hypothetical protein
MNSKLFHRDGRAFDPMFNTVIHGKKYPYYMAPRRCGRCGGLGGSDAWKHTGWKCYDCDGSGQHKNGPEEVRLYLAEELTKLNAAKEKRDTLAQLKRFAAEAKAKEEADARMLGFLAEYGELLTRAEKFEGRSEFIRDVRAKAMKDCKLTEKQAAALANAVTKFEESDRRKASSEYIGTVGARLRGLQVTVTRRIFVPSSGAYNGGSLAITTLRTEFGETIVVKSNSFCPPKGCVYVIDATVAEHSIYNGEKQTRLQRITVKERLVIVDEDRDAA